MGKTWIWDYEESRRERAQALQLYRSKVACDNEAMKTRADRRRTLAIALAFMLAAAFLIVTGGAP